VAFDLAIAAVLLLYTVIGWRKGLLSQAVGLCAIVAAWLAAPWIAPLIARTLFAAAPAGQLETEVASMLIAALLVVVAVYAFVRLIPEALVAASDGLKQLNRGAGAVFGGIRGVATVYFLLCALAWLEPGVGRRIPRSREALQQRNVMDVVRRNNMLLLMNFRSLDLLRKDVLVDADGKRATKHARAVARGVVRATKRNHPSSY